MGYAGSQDGLTRYAHDLAQCVGGADPDQQELLQQLRKDTWRELVASCFDLDVDEIPTLSIVDARNLMHKVSSKMMEPEILEEIRNLTAEIDGTYIQRVCQLLLLFRYCRRRRRHCYRRADIVPRLHSPALFITRAPPNERPKESDTEKEIAQKHEILQQIIVNKVYMDGNPSLVEEAGFGTGPKAYAKYVFTSIIHLLACMRFDS